jgi:mannose-1-phosphate guanylyltransferase
MKAYLLAGGRGERLRPLTVRIPKCLAPIDGRPLLQIWLDLCARQGVTDVLLNVSHHFDLVDRFLAGAPVPGVRVSVARETAPEGTAATVVRERRFVEGEESFWIFYADNLTDMRLQPIVDLHRSHAFPLTIGLFRTPTPHAAGIVDLDATGRVTSFVEKPPAPRSNLANAGVYLARQAIFDCIPATSAPPVDFGLHVLPSLVGRMGGFEIPEFYEDIGTPERLRAAATAWVSRRAPSAVVGEGMETEGTMP